MVSLALSTEAFVCVSSDAHGRVVLTREIWHSAEISTRSASSGFTPSAHCSAMFSIQPRPPKRIDAPALSSWPSYAGPGWTQVRAGLAHDRNGSWPGWLVSCIESDDATHPYQTAPRAMCAWFLSSGRLLAVFGSGTCVLSTKTAIAKGMRDFTKNCRAPLHLLPSPPTCTTSRPVGWVARHAYLVARRSTPCSPAARTVPQAP